MTSKLQLDSSEDYPPAEMINSWVQHVGGYLDCIFNIECVSMGAQEMASLNGRYRNKYKPTNILSFLQSDESEIVGSLVFCQAVVDQEIKETGMSYDNYWCHLIIHGLLHLAGYDHEVEDERLEMEALETVLLKQLNMVSPYEED